MPKNALTLEFNVGLNQAASLLLLTVLLSVCESAILDSFQMVTNDARWTAVPDQYDSDETGGREPTTAPPDTSEDLKWTEAPTALTAILGAGTYNKYLAPGQLLNKTTNIEVAVYLESMSSFKAVTMDFEVDMYLATIWFDHRLRHNQTNPLLVNDLRLLGMIWQPDLYFINSKAAVLQAVTTPNFMVLVYPDGLVFKSLRVAATLSCMMDFTKYPMDEQRCPLYIQSYAFVETVVNLTWFVDPDKGYPIGYNPGIRLNDMEIMGREHQLCSGWYPMLRGKGYWSCLEAHIRMKRQIMFHVLQTYIPTAMLVCISWLSFWLDPRASPARIGLTITTLLTLTTMSNGARQGLPQVSYVKAIDIWLSMCTAYVFCVLLEYTLVSFFIGRKNIRCSRHKLIDVTICRGNGKMLTVDTTPCTACADWNEKIAFRIDRMSRSMFPLTFLLCGTIYWAYYLWSYMQIESSSTAFGS